MHRNIFGFILIMAILLPLKAYSQSIDEEVNNNIKKAEALISEGNKSGAAQVYNQTAYLLRSNDRFDEAAELYQKVLDINLELGNRRGQMISHNNLSVLYLEAERYPRITSYNVCYTKLLRPWPDSYHDRSSETKGILPFVPAGYFYFRSYPGVAAGKPERYSPVGVHPPCKIGSIF